MTETTETPKPVDVAGRIDGPVMPLPCYRTGSIPGSLDWELEIACDCDRCKQYRFYSAKA